MIIDNVKVYTEEKTFVKGGIMLDGDKIQRVYVEEEKPQFGEKEVLDGEGAYAIPGLIDLHFHGCKGDDFCDGNEEALERIAQYEASIGVTAIAPATMTLPVEELKQILSVAAKYKKKGTRPKAADLVGINMEGPFISKVKKGAQDERNIIPCNVEIAEQFLEASDGLVKFIGIAPEDNEDYLEFILKLSKQRPVVRSIDIANDMNYSKPSISVAMKNLRLNGYINVDESGFITLTDSGMEIASNIYDRHLILRKWLEFLGISPETAEQDACKIEHTLSKETYAALRKHIIEEMGEE